jgi:hypothetical protein
MAPEISYSGSSRASRSIYQKLRQHDHDAFESFTDTEDFRHQEDIEARIGVSQEILHGTGPQTSRSPGDITNADAASEDLSPLQINGRYMDEEGPASLLVEALRPATKSSGLYVSFTNKFTFIHGLTLHQAQQCRAAASPRRDNSHAQRGSRNDPWRTSALAMGQHIQP